MVLLGESQVIQVFIVGLWTVLPLEILLLIKQGIWNSINWFSSAHCCTCSKPAHSFPTSEAVVFCVFNGMKWEVIACFLILVKLLPITVLQFAIYQFSITVLKSLLWERNLSEWVSEWVSECVRACVRACVREWVSEWDKFSIFSYIMARTSYISMCTEVYRQLW